MDTFDKLPKEKKERIINSAMNVFASHGYRKASVSDIAREAGISKPMIFTYFGSKFGCYEFLLNEMLRITFREFNKYKEKILKVKDYFERIILSVSIKIDVLKECPPLLAFATSMYKERDDEVIMAVRRTIAEGYALREMFLSADIDSEKFKNPQEARQIVKITEWISAGCAEEWIRVQGDMSKSSVCDFSKLLNDFSDCLNLLKKHFYKEEYL